MFAAQKGSIILAVVIHAEAADGRYTEIADRHTEF